MKNVMILTALTASFLFTGSISGYAKTSPASSKLHDISQASVLIPIEITNIKSNVVSFIIPSHAREYDKKGNAVKISGLYEVAQGKDAKCPYMLSTEVHKKVKNYNPMNGRAVVDATFSTEEQAKAAYDSKCVVIENVK